MKIKDYLRKARHLNSRVKRMEETIAELETQAEHITTDISDMPKAESPDPHSKEYLVAKILDMKMMLGDYMEELLKMKYDIIHMTDYLDSMDEQMVIEERYVKMKTWQDIADTMCVSVRSVYRIHGSALVSLEKIYAKN